MDQALKEFISIRNISNAYLFNRQGKVISSFNDQNLNIFQGSSVTSVSGLKSILLS